MFSRRAFHARLVAALAAAALPATPRAWATETAADDLLLNRLTFGANAESRARLASLGQQAWLEEQLSLPATDPGLLSRLAAARLRISYPAGQDENGRIWPAMDELRPLTHLSSDPADLVVLLQWDRGMDYAERIRPAQEVIAASLIRAVHAPAQLREVMTQFWHDHFNVNAGKSEKTAALFPPHDALLRAHAFGNFRQLLGEVAKSPAMLFYLNNDESRASPANENWARELLELHTLGAGAYLNDRMQDWRQVPGATGGLALGYLDLDVYEVARAFTGWSVGDGRWLAEGQTAPVTGRFHYVEGWHDPYQKRVLGVEFPPNRAPLADGEQVLDMLATHPATAQFLCEKIARRFVADDPPADLVAAMAAVFSARARAPDQIAHVLRAMVAHRAFAASPPSKLRRPFEFLAALYRATGAQVSGPENAVFWHLARAGWRQHDYGPPNGHPDRLEAWSSGTTLARLVDMALYAHDDWFGGAALPAAVPDPAGETVAAFLTRFMRKLVPAADPAPLLAALEADPGARVADRSPQDRQGGAALAVAFAALTPDFLLR